jgi:hypothetical protein
MSDGSHRYESESDRAHELTDDLLLTSGQRFRRFCRYLGLGSLPSLLLALFILVTGDALVAGVVAGVGAFVALSIATSVRSERGALVAGVVVAFGLLLMQLALAWLAGHPILPGE